jgi:hypothetical protein
VRDERTQHTDGSGTECREGSVPSEQGGVGIEPERPKFKDPGHTIVSRTAQLLSIFNDFFKTCRDRGSTILIVARHCKEAPMEISKRPHFNRRIVAFVLFLLIALSYLVLTLLDGRDPNQAHPTEAHHERQA